MIKVNRITNIDKTKLLWDLDMNGCYGGKIGYSNKEYLNIFRMDYELYKRYGKDTIISILKNRGFVIKKKRKEKREQILLFKYLHI